MISTAEKLAFDAESHSYSLGGRRLPSVTQVIRSILPGWQADEWYLQRGTAVHHGCRLMDEGRLDWSSVAPEIEGRLRAWQKFRAESPSAVVACERAMAHPLFGFAGTLDRVFAIRAEAVLVDIKSTIESIVKIQLGAYKILWEANGGERIKSGAAVELSDEGNYRTLWIKEKDFELAGRTFLACLTAHNFIERENLKIHKEKTV